ncbi:MAG: (d)CMP kinase, partial [Halobacteriovoraceae bacterium]|nr:(d)CMP kinase [Halobacteriovoraceae bacterium]
LAMELNFLFVDTGALYRAIGLLLHDQKIEFAEGEKLDKALAKIKLRYGVSDSCLIKGNGKDLTREIRKHHVSKLASQVAKLPRVRQYLLSTQRQLAKERICVMEGRDIGTVIFPKAFCKIFFTASIDVRTERRLSQLRETGESSLDFNQIKKDIEERDHADYTRKEAPLKQADDAILLDTSNMAREKVLEEMKKIVISQAENKGIKL